MAMCRWWMVGGGITQRAFLDAGAVNRFELFIMPIVLGDGIKLFPGKGTGVGMPLEDSHLYPSGVVKLTYGAQQTF